MSMPRFFTTSPSPLTMTESYFAFGSLVISHHHIVSSSTAVYRGGVTMNVSCVIINLLIYSYPSPPQQSSRSFGGGG
eukprot:scaffold27334_cov78-Skeletonema_dohrnii-CCMP3373.AAC.1